MTDEQTVDAMLWHTRATAWELLALSFRYPGVELVDAIASGEWVQAVCELAGALDLDLCDGWDANLNDYEDCDTDALLHALRTEATRLFVGAPEPMCSPFEGVWRSDKTGVQALLFVNPYSMEVERFCKACGLGCPEGTNEPLDHVATECELLEYLALRAGGVAVSDDASADIDLPGGSPAAAYETFLSEHARVWMLHFADATVNETREPLFRAAAHLLREMIAK